MKKVWWVIIGSVIILVLLPLAIDWLIIGNNFPSNISNSDWVGFLGGYIGSIMGCVISLVGILWTINFTREQNRADRELQIRPYFDIKYRDTPTVMSPKLCLGDVRIDFPGELEVSQTACGIIFIKNIGLGPAIDLDVNVTVHGMAECNAVFTTASLRTTTNSIQPNEEATIVVSIIHCNADPRTDGFLENFDFTVRLQFSNLLNDRFEQSLKFRTSFYKVVPNYQAPNSELIAPRFKGDIHLRNIGKIQKEQG